MQFRILITSNREIYLPVYILCLLKRKEKIYLTNQKKYINSLTEYEKFEILDLYSGWTKVIIASMLSTIRITNIK